MKISIVTLKNKKIDNFAKERNEALRQAQDKWVLFLDSDEIMSSELKAEIKNLDPGGYGGFYVKRKNYFLGWYAGTDKIIRLVKKGSGKWERFVHETYHPRGGTKIGLLKNYLIHSTAKDLHAYVGKINNYSTLHALANQKEGKISSLFKIVFYPKMKFLQNLLAGRGFVFSMLQSFHSFLGWSKLWFLQKTKK